MRKADQTNTFQEGVLMDLNPLIMPDNTMTSALNATLMTMNGNENVLQNDMGNGRVETAYLPKGYIPLGSTSFGGIIYVVSYNPLTNKSQIGSFPSPERNISSSEVSGMSATNISNNDFGWMDAKEGATKYYIKKIINQDLIFYPGDKFIVYSDNVASNYEKFYKEDDYTDLVKSIQTSRLDYLSLLALKQQNGEEISNKYDINKAIWELANKGVTVSDNFKTYKVDIENKFDERVNIRNNLESLKSELQANRDSFTANNSKYNSYVNLTDSLTQSIEDYTAEKNHYSSLLDEVSSKIPILQEDFDRIGAACDVAKGDYTIAQNNFLSAQKRYSDLSDLITKSENAVTEQKGQLSKIESAYAEAVSLVSSLTAQKSQYTNAANTAYNSYTELNKLIETNSKSIEDAQKQIETINADSEALSQTLNKHLGDLKNIQDQFDESLVNINAYQKENETLKSQLDAYEGYNYLIDRNESISSALDKWEAQVVPITYTTSAPAISGGISARPPIFDQIQPGRVDFEITDITDSVQADKYEAEKKANELLANELKAQFPDGFNAEMAAQSQASITSNNKLITQAQNNNFQYEAQISNLKNKVESVQTNIDLNTSKLQSFESKISSLQKDNGELEVQVSNLQSNETYYRNLAEGLESQITSASTRVDELETNKEDISSIIQANQVSINEYRDEIEAIDLDGLETVFNTQSHLYDDLLAQKYDADDKLVTATQNKNLFSAQVREFDNKITQATADKEIYAAEKQNLENILSKIDIDYDSLIDDKIPKVEDQLSTVNDSINDLINEATTTFDTNLLQTVQKQTIKIDLGCLTKDGKITKFNNLKQYHIPGVTITDSNNVDVEYRKQSDGSYKLQVKLSENNYADIISNLEEGEPKYIEDYDGLVYKDSDGEYKKVGITNSDKQYTYHIFQYSGAGDQPGDIDEYRKLVEQPYNIFTSKLAGNIVVIGELIQATDFDASIENTITEDKLYRPKFYLDLSNDTPFIPKGFKFEVTLTGNDGTNESTTFNMDFFDSEIQYETITEKITGEDGKEEEKTTYKITSYPITQEIYEVTTDCKTYNFEIDTADLTNKEVIITDDSTGQSSKFPAISPLKSIFDKLENYFNEGNTRNKEYIIEFKITPYMNWGYLPLESTISVELDKIGTNDISIKRWQYFVDDQVTLNWGIESYMSEGSSIENIEFIFRWPYDTSTIYGVKYSIPAKESYFGTYVETLPLDTESQVYVTYTDPGVTVQEFLHSNILALVEIRVNCNINGEQVTKKFYKWLYTTEVFNDVYLNKTEEDFCNLSINAQLSVYSTLNDTIVNNREFVTLGKYFYATTETPTQEVFKNNSVTKLIKKYLVDLNVQFQAQLSNNYNIFALLEDVYPQISVPYDNCGRVDSIVSYNSSANSEGDFSGEAEVSGESINANGMDESGTLQCLNNTEFISMVDYRQKWNGQCFYLNPLVMNGSQISSNTYNLKLQTAFAYEAKGYCDGGSIITDATVRVYKPIIMDTNDLNKYYFRFQQINSTYRLMPTLVGLFGYSSGERLNRYNSVYNYPYLYIGSMTAQENSFTQPVKEEIVPSKWGNRYTRIFLSGYNKVGDLMNSYLGQKASGSSLVPILYGYGLNRTTKNKNDILGDRSFINITNGRVYPTQYVESRVNRLVTFALLGDLTTRQTDTKHYHENRFIFLNCGFTNADNPGSVMAPSYLTGNDIQDFYQSYLSVLGNIYTFQDDSYETLEGFGITNLYYYNKHNYTQQFTCTVKIPKRTELLSIKLKSGQYYNLSEYKDLLNNWIQDSSALTQNIYSEGELQDIPQTFTYKKVDDLTNWFRTTMNSSNSQSSAVIPLGESEPISIPLDSSPSNPDQSRLYYYNNGIIREIQEGNTELSITKLNFTLQDNQLVITPTKTSFKCYMDLAKFLKYDDNRYCLLSKSDNIKGSGNLWQECYAYGYSNGDRIYMDGWANNTGLIEGRTYVRSVSPQGDVLLCDPNVE